MTFVVQEHLNPVTKARLVRGMNTAEFARLIGLTRSRLSQIENGHAPKLTRRVLRELERLGYDPETMAMEYQQWRERNHKEPATVAK